METNSEHRQECGRYRSEYDRWSVFGPEPFEAKLPSAPPIHPLPFQPYLPPIACQLNRQPQHGEQEKLQEDSWIPQSSRPENIENPKAI